LLQEGEGVAAKILRNLGVDVERVREDVLRELQSMTPPEEEEEEEEW
ncbi:MAG: Clp protease N-terminal domain-containing protein, partial [Armatimonadota bacterium]|nr:Clp protease N-terminal domain-containing protein [Armatimonadota bacterium]